MGILSIWVIFSPKNGVVVYCFQIQNKMWTKMEISEKWQMKCNVESNKMNNLKVIIDHSHLSSLRRPVPVPMWL